MAVDVDKINFPSPTVCKGGITDAAIEKGIIFLLIFTPLAIGTVQQWSIAIMEIVSFCIFGAWILKERLEEISSPSPPLQGGLLGGDGVKKAFSHAGLFLFMLLAMVAVIQITPLPFRLLSFLSPSTGRTYGTFLDNVNDSWLTLSLHSEATWEELLKLLSYAAVFSVIAKHYKTKEQLNKIFMTIVFMGFFLAVFAVVQKMTWNGRLFWFYPLQDGLNSDQAHIWGPYISRNHFAGYMEMAIPVGMGLLMHKFLKIRSQSNLSTVRQFVKFMDDKEFLPAARLFVAVIIMSAALIISLSRGGLLGLLISSLFFWGMVRSSRSLKKTSGAILLLGVTIFFAVIISTFSQIEDRFEEINIGDEERIQRLDVWSDTLHIVKEFPIFGTGLGTFRIVYPQYQTKHSHILFEHAENDYMQIMAEIGILGFLALSGIMYVYSSSVIKAWRARRNAFVKCIVAGGFSSFVAISVHSFTDFNMRIPANAMLLTVIAAATYATVFNIRERRKV